MSRTAHEWSERFFAQLMVEINAERAAALGRIGRELERARARAEELGYELESGEHPDPEVIDEYRQACAEAERWRWKLCVQREANGLYDHRWVDAIYPPLQRL